MSGLHLRPAVSRDAGAVRACVAEAFRPYIPLIGRKPAPMVADYPALIAAGHVHLAEIGGDVAGVLVCYRQGDAMQLECVAVAARFRGQGIGGRLIAHCEDEARRQGLAGVELYTNAAMTANQRIYPHLGYGEIGRRHEDGFARVYYRKVL